MPGTRSDPMVVGGHARGLPARGLRMPAAFLAAGAVLVSCSPGGSGPSETQLPSGSPAGRPPEAVLLSGDSITEGWHATTEELSFRGLVEEWLTEGGTGSVTGTFHAGFTVQEVADGFEVPRGVDLAVVELGTNDIGRNNPVGNFGIQYATYLDDLEEASPGVQLVCLGVWYPASDQTTGFDDAIERECTSRGGVFQPLSGLFGETGLRGPEGNPTWLGISDAFHPNDAGHERIAELVKERISALESAS